jgi:hypothetical protein
MDLEQQSRNQSFTRPQITKNLLGWTATHRQRLYYFLCSLPSFAVTRRSLITKTVGKEK